MTEPVAWLNGEFLPLSRAALSLLDGGVTTGASVTERLRTFRHRPFLVAEHLERFAASAAAAFVPLRCPSVDLSGLIDVVVARNAASLPTDDDLTISLFATTGTAAGPTLCLHAAPLPAAHYAADYDGQRLVIPPTRAMPGNVIPPHVKTRNRLHWHIADAQANVEESGAKALLIDADGLLTETAIGNVFLVRGGKLVTPRSSRVLPGISRAYAIRLAAVGGWEAVEEDLRAEDFLTATEAFVSSTITCLLPVVRVNRREIGDGRPGPVFRQLLVDWSAAVGVDIAAQMRRMAAPDPDRLTVSQPENPS